MHHSQLSSLEASIATTGRFHMKQHAFTIPVAGDTDLVLKGRLA
jgi:hypothetical protein